MWTLRESKDAQKILPKLPEAIRKKYTLWQNIVRQSGPQGLREIKGFHDEALKGQLRGQRSSRLNEQYRVIYRVESETVTVYVEKIDPHTYRK